MEINLAKYRRKNSRVFSGRIEGYDVRDALKLSELEKKYSNIIIKVPEDTLSFNTSFFLGVFGESVRNLGEVKFREVYQFQCPSIVIKQINDGIKRAIKISNPLERKQ
jgi:hypothetical protein